MKQPESRVTRDLQNKGVASDLLNDFIRASCSRSQCSIIWIQLIAAMTSLVDKNQISHIEIVGSMLPVIDGRILLLQFLEGTSHFFPFVTEANDKSASRFMIIKVRRLWS